MVEKGDAKELAVLMRQDSGFNVNEEDENYGWTFLHHACKADHRSLVIPLLLAHPDINVNVKDIAGWTPFYHTCWSGSTPCVRELLKDLRVKVNQRMT